MPRQTREQLEAEIVDRGAELFARHGFAGTSLQQIADAVGYSKAGLLHHFPSKEAIYLAVRAALRQHVAGLVATAERVPEGVSRDRVLVESLVDLTFTWPGIAQLAEGLSVQDDLDDPDLVAVAEDLASVFGLGGEASEDRVVRVLLVSSGVTGSAVTAVRAGMQRQWRAAIIEGAMNALGHRT